MITYDCKENDVIIIHDKGSDEILLKAKHDKAWTVVGIKDLLDAILSFGIPIDNYIKEK